jgi:hypothetical protein
MGVRHYLTARPASSAPAGKPCNPPSPGWLRRASFATLLSIVHHSSLIVSADTHYVALTGGHIPPFTNWADAATDIQSAVDEASPGDVVLVSNGVYDRSSPDLPAKRL